MVERQFHTLKGIGSSPIPGIIISFVLGHPGATVALVVEWQTH